MREVQGPGLLLPPCTVTAAHLPSGLPTAVLLPARKDSPLLRVPWVWGLLILVLCVDSVADLVAPWGWEEGTSRAPFGYGGAQESVPSFGGSLLPLDFSEIPFGVSALHWPQVH